MPFLRLPEQLPAGWRDVSVWIVSLLKRSAGHTATKKTIALNASSVFIFKIAVIR